MAGSAKRERQLARERYLRQQEHRQQVAARRRRRQMVATVAFVVVAVVAGVVALGLLLGGDGGEDVTATPKDAGSASPTPTATSPSPSPSTTEGSGCTYSKTEEPAAKDVGLPAYDESDADRYREPFTATVVTDQGDITIEMAATDAPCTTNSFRHLATENYFDSTPCHRLTTDNIFVLQCGDPTGEGSGGPGYQFGVENAPADGMYPAGTVAMARTSEPGSNGSQFFLVYEDTQLPDPNGYTVFGRITEGLDVVTAVAEAGVEGGEGDGKPAQPVTIENVRVGAA